MHGDPIGIRDVGSLMTCAVQIQTTAPTTSRAAHLLERCRHEPLSGCWLWMRGCGAGGYGQIWVGKNQYAHRASFETFIGPIPDGMWVLHKCDVPSCINPDHLFLGTNADNVKDRGAKGRHARQRGEEHGNAKLTEAEVIAIRTDTRLQREIARDHGVSRRAVSHIKKRTRWAHV